MKRKLTIEERIDKREAELKGRKYRSKTNLATKQLTLVDDVPVKVIDPKKAYLDLYLD